MTDWGEKLPQTRSVALIALGSNACFGASDPTSIVRAAVEALSPEYGVIRGKSDFFATPAFPLGSGPGFINAALVLETHLAPAALLSAMHEIELQHGRTRRTRWGPRSLDLDLLAHGDAVLPDVKTFSRWRSLPESLQRKVAPDEMILPHPRLQDRAFVLVPLDQALRRAGLDWVHPVTGRRMADMLADLPRPEVEAIKPLCG